MTSDKGAMMNDESGFENGEDHQIDYEGIAIIGRSTLEDAIFGVVRRLPITVAQWVVKNITFVDFTGISGLACHVPTSIPSEHRSGPDFDSIRLIIIVTSEKGESDATIEHRIAHEIAHHWLGHFEGSAPTEEQYEHQEQDADRLANEWGFEGRSTRTV